MSEYGRKCLICFENDAYTTVYVPYVCQQLAIYAHMYLYVCLFVCMLFIYPLNTLLRHTQTESKTEE